MSRYKGQSTREAELERLLESAINTLGMARMEMITLTPRVTPAYARNLKLAADAAKETIRNAREALDAKCAIHVHPAAETLQRGGVQQGKTCPCELPAGHSGSCYASE